MWKRDLRDYLLKQVLRLFNFMILCGKKYKEDFNKPISVEIGYPYNTVPKGYPNKISSKKINETVDKILEHLKANAGSGNINSDYILINLGTNELNNRKNNKQTKMALILSIISIIIATGAFIISFKGSTESNKILNKQLHFLESISKD